jgi:hypothetical protein
VSSRESHRQLGLFDARLLGREARLLAARRVADEIAEVLGEPVRLTVHDNRSTMVSFRRAAGALHYRVHHMFLDAPGEVIRALAQFAGPARGSARRRHAGGAIDAFVRQRRDRIGAPRVGRLQPHGRAHDLQAIFDRLNAQEFGGAIEARIGWGAVRPGQRRRTVKTGVYLQDARVIRIHPTLDRPEVPEYYVAAVVFHEMLHQAVPAREVGGRRIVHGADFRRRERAYPDFARARAWELRHLSLLLSSPDACEATASDGATRQGRARAASTERHRRPCAIIGRGCTAPRSSSSRSPGSPPARRHAAPPTSRS